MREILSEKGHLKITNTSDLNSDLSCSNPILYSIESSRFSHQITQKKNSGETITAETTFFQNDFFKNLAGY